MSGHFRYPYGIRLLQALKEQPEVETELVLAAQRLPFDRRPS